MVDYPTALPQPSRKEKPQQDAALIVSKLGYVAPRESNGIRKNPFLRRRHKKHPSAAKAARILLTLCGG